jgi:hypothetical protein
MRTGPLRLLTKRRLMLPLALLAAAVVPLAALGAASDWWFLQNHGPTPVSAPDVVKEGEWSGHRWQLIAYRSRTHSLCFSVTPAGSEANGTGGAMSCTTFVGVPRTAETKGSSEMTITFLSGAAGSELPAYIAGPVIDKASTVEIEFETGEVLRLPTFSGPASLGQVRFYAAQLPNSVHMPLPRPGIYNQRSFINSLAGLDSDGNVVACLAPRTAVGGVSPLSDCQPVSSAKPPPGEYTYEEALALGLTTRAEWARPKGMPDCPPVDDPYPTIPDGEQIPGNAPSCYMPPVEQGLVFLVLPPNHPGYGFGPASGFGRSAEVQLR